MLFNSPRNIFLSRHWESNQNSGWTPQGLCLDSGGLWVDSAWTPGGLRLDSMWTLLRVLLECRRTLPQPMAQCKVLYNASLCHTGQCRDEHLTWSSGVSIYIVSEAAAIFSKSCNINIDWVSSCEVGAAVIWLFMGLAFMYL